MTQKKVTNPKLVILREIRIQEVLYDGEITLAVINKSQLTKKEANKWLEIANYIIQNFNET